MTGMNHNSLILAQFYSKLNEFCETGEYVDVTIQCEDRIFQCHKLALAIASDYFKVMFAGNFKESSVTNVLLHEIDAETFDHILRFIYSGHIVINSGNVCSLLRASDFFRIQYIEDLCVKFIKEMKATAENIKDIFAFVQAANKSELLTEIENLYIIPHLSIFFKIDIFFEATFEYVSKILSKYSTMLPERKDDTLLLLQSVVIQWICHQKEERLQYLDEFFHIIECENIFPQYSKIMVEKAIASNSVPLPIQQIINKSVEGLLPFLHIYIKYISDNVIEIFSIDSNGDYTPNGMVDGAPKFHERLHVTPNDTYIYRWQFLVNAKNVDYIDETFSVATSVNSSSWLAVAPPPVRLSLPRLCSVQNNIYLHGCNPQRQSPTSNGMFTDEEINRCVYGYNCDLDKWFPVPPTKKKLNDSYLTACGDMMYLVGQAECDGSVFERMYVQAYDFRIGDWRELPASTIEFGSDTTFIRSCCVLESNIYVVYCDEIDTSKMARYDIIAEKWEPINTDNLKDMYFPTVTPFENKIWMTEAVEWQDILLLPTETKFRATIYDPVLNKFSVSRVLSEATFEKWNACEVFRAKIVDCVVFKK